MEHNPNYNSNKVQFLPTPMGNLSLFIPCTCDRDDCTFNAFIERNDFQHNPAPLPPSTYILGSKIRAIKEIRTIMNVSLTTAKSYVDSAEKTPGKPAHLTGQHNGFKADLFITFIENNDWQHCAAITTKYDY